MRSKILALLSLTAVIGSIFVSSMAVYADSYADAYAVANGGSPSVYTDAGDNSFAWAGADADGNIAADADAEGSVFKAVAIAEATSDNDSYADVDLYAQADQNGSGWANVYGQATATDGGYSEINAEAYVYEREGGAGSAVINVTAFVTADGYDAGAEADLSYAGGSAYIDNGSEGRLDVEASVNAIGDEADAQIETYELYIVDNSSGAADVVLNANAIGVDAYAYVYGKYGGFWDNASGTVYLEADANAVGDNASAVIGSTKNGTEAWVKTGTEAWIEDWSTGSIDATVNASATGTNARAYIDDAEFYIDTESSGTVEFTVDASASGTGSYAYVEEAYGVLDYGSTGSIEGHVDADATGGAFAEANADVGIYDGDTGNYIVYSIADASGENGYAYSNIEIDGSAPNGGYIAVDGDANGFAIAFVLIYGNNNVIAVNWVTTDGGTAAADIEIEDGTVFVDAIVGFIPTI